MADIVLRASSRQFMPTITDWTPIAEELGLKDQRAAKKAFYALCERRNWFVADDASPESESWSQPGPSSTPQRRVTRRTKTTPNTTKKHYTRSSSKNEPEIKFENIESMEGQETSNFDELFDFYAASNDIQDTSDEE
ncbi:hypothetical protein F4774DRAFT_428617 [Daldinia eschscholtzii]|nr:hypothetical protein F4774DRAFT_428617 [Daldinia eschscholtzii]